MNRYRITAAGRDAFASWLGAFAARGAVPDSLRSPLVVTVFCGPTHQVLLAWIDDVLQRLAEADAGASAVDRAG